MSSVFDNISVQPLILELLSRRNRLSPGGSRKSSRRCKSPARNAPRGGADQGGFISEQEIASVYAEDLFLPVGRRDEAPVDKELGSLLPEKLCVDRLICPMAVRDDVLDVAFVSPEEMGVVDELQLMTGLRINPLIAPLSVVKSRLDVLYRTDRDTKAIGEGTERLRHD